MAANNQLQSFYELRIVLEHLREGADAALRFMDATGLAPSAQRKAGRVNGVGNLQALKAGAKKMFQARHDEEIPPMPDGQHITVKEAAKLLKRSDATVRNAIHKGTLKSTFELRAGKAYPAGRKTAVLLKADVLEARKTIGG